MVVIENSVLISFLVGILMGIIATEFLKYFLKIKKIAKENQGGKSGK